MATKHLPLAAIASGTQFPHPASPALTNCDQLISGGTPKRMGR